MPHSVGCEEYEQDEACNAAIESAQVLGPDVDTGEIRSIYVVHECEWRLWTDEDQGWNATLHDGVHGCFDMELADSELDARARESDHVHRALFTLTLFQFLLIIIGVL